MTTTTLAISVLNLLIPLAALGVVVVVVVVVGALFSCVGKVTNGSC